MTSSYRFDWSKHDIIMDTENIFALKLLIFLKQKIYGFYLYLVNINN